MKTTLNIDDSVMERLRSTAAARGCSMSELVEAGLRRVLAEEPAAGEHLPELPNWHCGGSRIDLANRDALLDAMEAD